MKKKLLAIGTILLLLGFLLVNPTEAVAGSRTGLLLWFQSVVPVLLPFMILSRLLISFHGLAPVIGVLSPVTRWIWGLSPMGTYALLLGFLCGYPMGAKIVGDLVRDEKISLEEGNYLLCFCNNVSPAFLLGFTMSEHMKSEELIPLTLCLVYGTPLILAVFWRNRRTFINLARSCSKATPIPAQTEKQASGFQISFKIVDACIMNGLESILKLGCYIILFSITARLAALIPWPHEMLSGICIGVLEITNGIAAVSQLQTPFFARYLAVLGFLTFGGLSGVAQANSMIQGSGLSTGNYVRAKLETTGVVILSAIALFILLPSAHLFR